MVSPSPSRAIPAYPPHPRSEAPARTRLIMSDRDEPPKERPELTDLRARLHATTDAARPEAVARRRKTGQRTARENIADLVDPGSFVEYGALAVAAQRRRRSIED